MSTEGRVWFMNRGGGGHLLVLALLGGACGSSETTPDAAGPPEVLSISPADGTATAWLHDAIAIAFSTAVDPATVTPDSIALVDDTGAAIATTASLSEDGLLATVRVADGFAYLGGVTLSLSAAITNLDGIPMTAASFGWTLPPWSAAPDADGADSVRAPVLLAGPDDEIFAAWESTADAGAVVVQRLLDGVWQQLGDNLGDGGASAPALAIDADGSLIAAWAEAGAPSSIETARWDGIAWTPLPSPGDGITPVLATVGAASAPVLAWQVARGGLSFARLDDAGTWQAVVGDLSVTGAIVGTPSMVLADATAPIIGLVEKVDDDASATLRVVTWTGVWNERPPIRLRAPRQAGQDSHLALAIAGGELYAAWDEDSGYSWSVQVALATSDETGWAKLGPELDIDTSDDARAPSIAIDDAGRPVVAWHERGGGDEHGYVSRWSGTAWEMVGGDSWTPDAPPLPDQTALLLWRGRVPVVAWTTLATDAPAALHLTRFNGPATARFGLETRVTGSPCVLRGEPPTKLSLTGCFTIADGAATPSPGLVPYDLISELWSDGALKRRWLVVPDGTQLTVPVNGRAFTAPAGTMVIKEFALETTPGDPSTRRVMETRFLIVDPEAQGGVRGYSYQWRTVGDDADLLPDEASTLDWETSTGVYTHTYPSRAECLRCHAPSTGPLLGLRAGQLARKLDYDGIAAEQLPTLAHLGLIDAAPATVDVYTAPQDPRAPLEDRVRGYLAANCAHCHNPNGERPTRDFRWEVPLASTHVCDVIVPGNIAGSSGYTRVAVRPGMPPLASREADPLLLDIFGSWIDSIATCP